MVKFYHTERQVTSSDAIAYAMVFAIVLFHNRAVEWRTFPKELQRMDRVFPVRT